MYANCSIKIDDSGLLECQQISSIQWGDGTSDVIEEGEVFPTHSYTENGTYEVCYQILATTNDGGGDMMQLPYQS